MTTFVLSIANGSLAELETHMIVAERLGYTSRDQTDELWRLSQRVGQMLIKLIQSLRFPIRMAS